MDVLFVNTNSSKVVYQDLAKRWSAVEPPTWSLLLAEACRNRGYGVGILDANAENLTPEQTAQRIVDARPMLLCFVTYGQNPNSGTTSMAGVYEVAKLVRQQKVIPTLSIGSHSSALPREVLTNKYIDMVSINEGVYTLFDLLEDKPHKMVRSLGYKFPSGHLMVNNGVIVPQERMDIDMPGYAWDLLPYNEKPLDLYRAHTWHAEYQEGLRTPFASIYTSLGCPKQCSFLHDQYCKSCEYCRGNSRSNE